MSDAVITKEKRKTAADYKALAAQILEDITRLEEQMDRYSAEGERIKIETQAIKAHTAVTRVQLREQMKRLSEPV